VEEFTAHDFSSNVMIQPGQSDKRKFAIRSLKSPQDFAKYMVFLIYLAVLYYITRSSATPRKTAMWMLITLFVTLGAFIGLALLPNSPQAVSGLGRLGGAVGMVASIGVGLVHIRSRKRPTSGY